MPAVDQVVDPDTYVCGPGDVLDLSFWGLQNFRHRVTIDLEGRAFVPRIGYQALGGQTLSQVRASLRESVGRFYPRLGFDLALADPRTFLVQAVGDVGRPGSYPARAVERVAALLLRAGGLGSHASKRRIEVRRRGGAVPSVPGACWSVCASATLLIQNTGWQQRSNARNLRIWVRIWGGHIPRILLGHQVTGGGRGLSSARPARLRASLGN